MPRNNTVILEVGQHSDLTAALLNSKLVKNGYVPVTMETIFNKYISLNDSGAKANSSAFSWTVDAPAIVSIIPDGPNCRVTAVKEGEATVICQVTAPIARTTRVRVIVLLVDPQPQLVIVAGPARN